MMKTFSIRVLKPKTAVIPLSVGLKGTLAGQVVFTSVRMHFVHSTF